MDLRSFVLLFTVCATTDALTCHQCSNLELQSGNSAIEKLFSGKTDPDCLSGNSGDYVSCDPGSSCVAIQGTVSVRNVLFGSVKVKTLVRDCLPTDLSDGCYGDDNQSRQVKNVIGGILSAADEFNDISLDGNMCLCSYDFCLPECSGFYIGDFCMQWLYLGLAVGGAVLLVVSLCICCCCCCCRKSPKPAGASVMVMQGGAVGGVSGLENPGYGQNYVLDQQKLA